MAKEVTQYPGSCNFEPDRASNIEFNQKSHPPREWQVARHVANLVAPKYAARALATAVQEPKTNTFITCFGCARLHGGPLARLNPPNRLAGAAGHADPGHPRHPNTDPGKCRPSAKVESLRDAGSTPAHRDSYIRNNIYTIPRHPECQVWQWSKNRRSAEAMKNHLHGSERCPHIPAITTN